jgi:DNA-3-methyladenine glycosylase II
MSATVSEDEVAPFPVLCQGSTNHGFLIMPDSRLQVSGAAAASIRKKFTTLFEDTYPAFPSPAQVVEKDIATLRTAGLSQRKSEYIQGLAEKFASGELSAQMLVSASDEDLIEKLVAVRGLG